VERGKGGGGHMVQSYGIGLHGRVELPLVVLLALEGCSLAADDRANQLDAGRQPAGQHAMPRNAFLQPHVQPSRQSSKWVDGES